MALDKVCLKITDEQTLKEKLAASENDGADRSLTPSPAESPQVEMSPRTGRRPKSVSDQELDPDQKPKSKSKKQRKKKKVAYNEPITTEYIPLEHDGRTDPDRIYDPIIFDENMDPFMANATIELDSKLEIPDSELTVFRLKNKKKAEKAKAAGTIGREAYTCSIWASYSTFLYL